MKHGDEPTAVLALKSHVKSVDFPESLVNGLSKRFPNVKFRIVSFHPQQVDHLSEAEILYTYTITPALLGAAPKLKWFHSVVTGPDTYTFPELINRNIIVTSPRGIYAVPIAETALGLMLSLTRKIQDSILLQTKRCWAAIDIYNSFPPAGELYESTIVIFGQGGIGTALAQRCHALGMRVIGVVPTPRLKPDFVDELILPNNLGDVLKIADFVALACPLTGQTKGLIGRRELGLMKKTAYLINIARGELVDETALVKALKSGTIGGAACDVFTTEPLPADHPFYTTPNMIVMPHVSGWSARFWERAVERFATNLELYLNRKPLIGEVDFNRGY